MKRRGHSLALFLMLLPGLSTPASAATTAKPSVIDARAIAIFDRAISGLKEYRSFSLAAEEYILDTSPPQERFVAGSLQWPYRAKLKITGDNVAWQALVGRERALFWNGEHTTTLPLKTQAERERQILRVFEDSLALALGPVSLRAGINPARLPGVKSADYTRVSGDSIKVGFPSGERIYFRVHLTRATGDAARPLLFTYFFSGHARLDRLEIARTIGGKLFRARRL
jgi:hypothetical protein